MIQEILQVMDKARKQSDVKARVVIAQAGLAYSSVMRWQRRRERGEPVVQQVGPKKVAPLDLHRLRAEVYALEHRNKRSLGAPSLYERNREAISRRQVSRLTKAVRRQLKDNLQDIHWKSPGVVWSMDETGCQLVGKREEQILQVQDLGSSYKLEPLTARRNHGKEIAGHLQGLFKRWGPPLFLKRDNGRNLNHHLVEEVLERWHVIPLNSPPYFPRYNGGIEKAQSELQKMITFLDGNIPLPLLAVQAVHELNHQNRRRLKGRNACRVFHDESPDHRFNKRLRKEIYDWIKRKASSIMKQSGGPNARNFDNAWRVAVKMWLQQHGHITVIPRKQVLPDFQKILSRN